MEAANDSTAPAPDAALLTSDLHLPASGRSVSSIVPVLPRPVSNIAPSIPSLLPRRAVRSAIRTATAHRRGCYHNAAAQTGTPLRLRRQPPQPRPTFFYEHQFPLS